MAAGNFTIVLHSHLPWVLHHGRWPHGVDWLNEAAAETYLPLWRALNERAGNGAPRPGARGGGASGALGITLGLSPVLCEQLAHPDFHREFLSYLEQKIAAAVEDRKTFTRTGEGAMGALAQRWEQFYRSTLEDFMGPEGPNLVQRFRRLEEQGAIEIVTCGATHGYLPLLGRESAVEGQVRVARTTHRRHFGRDPRGIWLPECAYRPAGPWTSPLDPGARPQPRRGVEEVLAAHGLGYFFVDRHLLSGGRPLGVYADRFEALRHVVRENGGTTPAAEHPPYRPYRVGNAAKVACFGRDSHTAIQVWSGEHGYPGSPPYLDFHKKRFPGGHRYWSVTHPKADLAHKTIYRPAEAEALAPEHAAHFLSLVEQVARDAAARQSDPPVVCAMYDAELFGHWWFEGPRFLAAVIDRARGSAVSPVTAGEYLERHPPREVVALPEGSWGEGGGHDVWMNDATRWTWGPVHAAEARFEAIASRGVQAADEPLLSRLLAQLGREQMLLEASDWQFLITTFAARDYAELRVSQHAADFERLALLAERRLEGGAVGESDEQFLAECEARDSLFPDFDWRGYATPAAAGAIAAG
ncbi:MAG TPA: 1,4-alpha-glucan branching protein domain-containing protein [Candidatus Eisenbacteria bacterium]|jgi:1,4-alpha-glucan branching enzyme